MSNKEWLYIEHDIRYLLDKQESEMTVTDFAMIDELKSAIIALFGCKVFGDTNEIFYFNMKENIKRAVKHLGTRFPEDKRKLEKIKDFVLNNL